MARHDLDPDRSVIVIRASSSIHPIHTEAAVTGWFDPDAPAGEIGFDLGGMRSGNPLIDREAERRLHIRRHPTVRGVLTSMAASEDVPSTWDATGDLTFHGVTRSIDGQLRVEERDGVLGITGATRIDVTDFGVQPPSLLLVKVHAEVEIELRAFTVAAGR